MNGSTRDKSRPMDYEGVSRNHAEAVLGLFYGPIGIKDSNVSITQKDKLARKI